MIARLKCEQCGARPAHGRSRWQDPVHHRVEQAAQPGEHASAGPGVGAGQADEVLLAPYGQRKDAAREHAGGLVAEADAQVAPGQNQVAVEIDAADTAYDPTVGSELATAAILPTADCLSSAATDRLAPISWTGFLS